MHRADGDASALLAIHGVEGGVQLLEPAAHERVELLEADAAAAVHVNLSHQPYGIRLRQVELLQYLLERGGK